MKTAVTFLIFAAFLAMPYGLLAQQEKTQAPAAQTPSSQQPAAEKEAPVKETPFARTPAPQQQPVAENQEQKKEAPSSGMMGCESMMKHHENMRAERSEMMMELDARLDRKVAAMNAARGKRKIEAMAAVINEMVAQRKEMREQMMMMRSEKWMEHRKEHKGKGGNAEGADTKGKSM